MKNVPDSIKIEDVSTFRVELTRSNDEGETLSLSLDSASIFPIHLNGFNLDMVESRAVYDAMTRLFETIDRMSSS
jgi:hypothetical protein